MVTSINFLMTVSYQELGLREEHEWVGVQDTIPQPNNGLGLYIGYVAT